MISFFMRFNSTRWIFQYLGCVVAGFVMYFIACVNIHVLVAISIER